MSETLSTPAFRPLDANVLQRRAADPDSSVWVGASAGSGKTKVLSDRVLRLMLSGTPPERILCLTFTKAAAAEMANRINQILGRWAVEEEDALRDRLQALTGVIPRDIDLRAARRLFAQVLDAAGGMQIQTIHAFCQSLLRRFPLEAGLPPHFEVMDDRTAAELLGEAREEILEAARVQPGEPLGDALARMTAGVSEEAFGELIGALAAERGQLRRILTAHGGLAGAVAAVNRVVKVGPDEDEADVIAAACRAGAFDDAGLRNACRVLADSSEADSRRGIAVQGWLDRAAHRVEGFEAYGKLFLTEKGEVRKQLLAKKAADRDPSALDALQAEAERLAAVQERLRGVLTARSTAALLTVGEALIDRYDRLKGERALLDFDDLILAARRLMSASPDACAWVLFKLDGGLDHILIDEAQDTNPDQWGIVSALADEFFSGHGAGDRQRTLFVVGDEKQSIFSFQRADPAEFARMRDYFRQRVNAANERWEEVNLAISFRSTAAVLRAVDLVFALDAAHDGVGRPEVTIQHTAFRAGMAGRVELWPLSEPVEAEAAEPWAPPVERTAADDPPARLARVIARQIREWLDRGERLQARDRPLRPGDVLILVRRRGLFMEELVRALKECEVPVAGVDRMVLTQQLAVMDLLALGRFLVLPEDDLTLATLLKSPLIGLQEDELFALAHGRTGSLWHALSAAGGERLVARRAYLADLLARTDHERPFELFAGALARPCPGDVVSGRRAFLGRLGPEAADPLDEFLSACLLFEREHVASLQGLLHWIEAGETQIKRELDVDAGQGPGQVRIMTVHGSKGLQAPVVILPDTTGVPTQSPRILWPDGARTVPLFVPRRAQEDTTCRAARAAADRRRDQEYRRLLYVALTRAEDRLYVCGWRGERSPSDGCWYRLVEQALAPVAYQREVDFSPLLPQGWRGTALVLDDVQTVDPKDDQRRGAGDAEGHPLPHWAGVTAAAEPSPTRPLTPSRPDAPDPPVASPLRDEDVGRFQRGVLVHKLLQVLPDLPPDRRRAAAAAWLARPAHGLPADRQQAIAAEALAILEHPVFAPLFGPDSRAEVPLVGLVPGPDGPRALAGQIDRLAISGGAVWIVDYKTNRPPPRTEAEVPAVYLAQMAAYRTALRGIFPDKPVRCVLVWTDGPSLMELPPERLAAFAPADPQPVRPSSG
jgi:ATP-dependent helicase/nuclease subunit A